MSDPIKKKHLRFENPNGAELHHGHGPYWKRAHRDWRIWMMVILMLAAMAVYVMTGDLSWRMNGQLSPLSQPISTPAGN
jgi:hypothetical protein